MREKYPKKWEKVTDEPEAGCSRLKIYGGWLVVAWANPSRGEPKLSESLVYVPDPEHRWKIKR